MLDRPPFVYPASTRLQDNKGLIDGPLLADVFTPGQPFKISMHRHAQHRENSQIPIDCMGVVRRTGDNAIIKPSCSFTGFIQTKGEFAVGEPRKEGASR